MDKPDKIDIKLLAELVNDSRQTLSQIAKKLNTSQQVISYRLKSLENRNIVGGYFDIINITELGYTSYRTMLRLSNVNEEKYKEIINYLMQHPNVLWIVECGGRWDLIVNFLAKNVIHYNNIFREFKNKFPEQIQNYDILATVDIIDFGRDYFGKNSRDFQELPYLGKEFGIAKLDDTNLQILNLISKNARMSSVEISQKIGVSPNTVMLRINEMKKSGIIRGFRILLHLENTTYSSYKALIKSQNLSEEKEKEIINYMKTNVNVVGFIKLIGPWDFEMEFEVESKDAMLNLTRKFRDRFKDVIKEFEVIPLFHEYRYNFFPGDILNKTMQHPQP